MSDRLLTYLYQYSLGAVIYLVTLYVLWRTGALGDDPRTRRRWIAVCVVGLALYALGQGALQFLGPEYDLDLGGAP